MTIDTHEPQINLAPVWADTVTWLARHPECRLTNNLTDAYLADANLARANLTDAYLTDAYLTDAYLADANLAGANLAGANLAGANLARANLTDANLTDAYLARANLTDAYLAGAVGIIMLYIPGMSSRGDYLYAVHHTDAIMVKAGCWWSTLSDFRVRVQEIHRGNHHAVLYLAACDLIETAFRESAS